MKLQISVLAILIIFSSLSFAADVPQYVGYVNDYANALNNAQSLEAELQNLDSNTSIEFAIITLKEIPADETRDSYAYKIFNTWGIGKANQDNGLLFLMIVNQSSGNRMRLEIGYGLEGYITDAAAGRILDAALPYYETGNYSAASQAVVSGVLDKLQGYRQGNPVPDDFPVAVLISILSFLMIFAFMGIMFSITRCPKCGSTHIKCEKETCVCQKCGFRFKKKKKRAWPYVFIGGMGSGSFGGGGFGGFGGGGGGGGGAGR